ncbi:MAG: peptide ABC transporter substrate-binding protein, partial [Fusobacteriaceae bacterium]
VRALDEKTLVVKLESPTPYFLKLVSSFSYLPVRKDIIEKNPTGWTLKPETYVSNGPFKMSKINPKEDFILEKNQNYWDKEKVRLSKIKFTVIEDSKTALNEFKKAQSDLIDGLPPAEVPGLLKDGIAVAMPVLGTYFYSINVSGKNMSPEVAKFLQNPNVRRALILAIDRNELISKVVKGGQTAATTYVPKGVTDANGKEFITKSYFPPEGNIEEAKALMKRAGYDSPEKIPKISFIFNIGDLNSNIAQAVQDMWRKNLGVNIELKNMEWSVFTPTRNNHEYEIARHTWLADYNDPMTFLDMWVTGVGNNAAGYSNYRYDSLIKMAKKETNEARRVELLHKAEDILMADMPIIPLYYWVSNVCANPKLKGWIKSPLGTYNFKGAYFEK